MRCWKVHIFGNAVLVDKPGNWPIRLTLDRKCNSAGINWRKPAFEDNGKTKIEGVFRSDCF